MSREILHVDFSQLDYSPEEAESSANAVYDAVETYKEYREETELKHREKINDTGEQS